MTDFSLLILAWALEAGPGLSMYVCIMYVCMYVMLGVTVTGGSKDQGTINLKVCVFLVLGAPVKKTRIQLTILYSATGEN